MEDDITKLDLVPMDDAQEFGIGTLILGGLVLLGVGAGVSHVVTKKRMDAQIDRIVEEKIKEKLGEA